MRIFSNVLVLTMARKDLEDKASVQTKKIEKLESLCRALTSRKAAESTSESRPEESVTNAVNQENQAEAEAVAPQDKEQTKTEEEQVQN
ncbi:hypothetical protein WR25_18248 [Diploscapter pachys]|uniref:Uncharacterized protein n=1 Tax=Diploscapter pachys TaxID=2018661 RepID=A0A2A2LVP9_9BILA|nr:hypothetical protein WR25_18248 [Diploscapter pachys]